MRLHAVLFTAILATAPTALASSSQTSAEQAVSSAAAAPNDTQSASGPLNLPVSLDRIREGLKQTPLVTLRGLNEVAADQVAHFKIEIEERRKIEELLATLNFKGGPVPAGGPYAYEQQRRLFPPVDNPLVQPWAAFNTSQLLVLTLENIIRRYLGGRVMNAVSTAERTQAERAAREEVARALADFCAAQPNHGAGIQACSMAPAIR